MDLTVVVPTYQEAGNIARLVRELRASLVGVSHEILVVDDNSSDGTAEAARAAGAVTEVRIHERGLATAVLHGIRHAKGRYVAVIDADFQHPVEMPRRLYENAIGSGSDVVVGTRYRPGGDDGSFGPIRRAMSHSAATMAKVALPPVRKHNITDPMSGLFLVRRAAVDVDALRPQGYKILLEILGRCQVGKVTEVPYKFASRAEGASKLGGAVLMQYLMHLLALAWDHPDNRRVLHFGVVGLSGVVVNLGLLWVLHGLLGLHDLYAVLIALEASVLSNFILNDRWTFHDRRQGHALRRMLQFHLVSFLVIGINIAAYSFFTRALHWHYLAAEAAAIIVAFAGNYLGNLHWTYGKTDTFWPGARQLLPYIPLMLVVVGASVMYVHDLDDVHEVYFDEHFYLSVARQIDNGVWEDPCWEDQDLDHRPLNFEHPPLAKLMIAWSIAEFDSDHTVFEGCREPDSDNYNAFIESMKTEGNPYAWRMPSAILGIMAVTFAGLATARIFRDPYAGALAALFVAVDGLMLTHARMALLDIFAAGFTIAAIWAATFPTKRGIIAAGLLLGAGFASKFTVLFAGPGVLLLVLWTHHRAGKLTRSRFDMSMVFVPLLPAVVWFTSMAPWLRIWTEQSGLKYALVHLWDITKAAIDWGANAQQEHPYQSSPLQWLTFEKPIFYYSMPAGGAHRYIWSFGNPILWWSAMIAIAIAVVVFIVQTMRHRAVATGAVGALFIAALLPSMTYAGFFLLARDQFIFYMVLVVPMMVIPLAGGLRMLQKRTPLGWIPLGLVALGGVAAFMHFWPIHMGTPIDARTYDAITGVIPWAW